MESAHAQTCPGNIDFENGSFSNWQCLDGRISLSDDPLTGPVKVTILNSAAIPGRHDIMSAQTLPALDFYGNFPVLAPNGSNYSVKIGNIENGGLVTGVKYNIQIPATDDKFYLEYMYAVVYESPNHSLEFQPRFEIRVKDIATGEQLDCSSLIFYANPSQAGFLISNQTHDGIQVLYKNWAPSTLFLKNMAGKNVEISFIVTGCGYAQHFGYAYLDVGSLCAERFPGASFCPNDTAIRVQGPAGYETYQWYSQNYGQTLAASQNLTVQPPPANNTIYNLVTRPFYKPNCIDTFQVKVSNDLILTANAGPDTSFCVGQSVRIGTEPQDGVTYRWSPAAGLSNPNISNPLVNVSTETRYTVVASSFGGGCTLTDDILVSPYAVNTKLSLIGKDSVCLSRGDSAVLVANVTDKITWYRDSSRVNGITGNRLKVTASGKYYAEILTPGGCSYLTDTIAVYVEQAIAGIRYPTLNLVTGYNFEPKARQIGEIYLWTPATDLSDPTIYNPILLAGNNPQNYLIKITTPGGCTITDTLSTLVFPKIIVYVPSAFTPNGDGRNDFLKPVFRGFATVNYFKVFNRYGQEVFDLKKNPNGWDGRVRKEQQTTAAYVWVAEGIGVDKKVYKEKGTVILLR